MIKIDVAKAGAQLFNLSNLFNARVNDGFTPVKVQWVNSTDSNKPLDVKAMKAFLKGQIGQGTIKDDHVELEPKSDLVSWEDDGSGSQLNGITLIKLPPQVFTRDGVFYGYIGLEDANGTTITSINIWFNVDQNVMTAGANVPYYLDEIQASLSAVQRSNDTLQRAKQEIDNQISLSKAAFEPEGFENETALKAKYPAGASGLMVTVDTGHKWLWIKGAWVDCGIYQAAGLADGVVHTRHTDFAAHQVDIFKEKDALVGIYNIMNGKIVFQNASVNKHYGDFTCFKFKINPNEQHTYTVSGTDFNVFGSTEDGALAWSDNNVDGVTGPYTFTVPGNVVWVYVTFLTANYDKYHCFVGDVHFDETGRFLLDAPLASPISDGIVTPETTTFIEGHSNLFDAFNSMNGIYNIMNGKIVFQNASVNKHYGDFTCFKFKVDSNEHTYTVSNTDFNVFGSTEDGTLAWSDNQSDGVTGPYTFTVPDNVVWVYVTFLTKRINGYKAVVGRDLGQVGYRLSDKIEVPLASPISDGIVTPETTTFIEGHSNLFDAFNSMNGIYNIMNGKIVFQNASVNKHYGDFTCFKFKVDSNEHTYTVSNTDFNVFGSTEDGTLAWSDNQSDGVTGPYTFTVPDNVVWVYVTFLTKRINGYKAVVGRDLGQVGYRLSDKIEVPNKGALQVHVGKGYQYERLIDAVNSINPNKDNVYTIYLHDTSNDYAGTTFDLLEELGGSSYLATIEDAKDNSQGFSIPAYVNLVGIGKVTLIAELPSNVTLNQSTNFSTIELKQGNNKLSNLTIKIKNGRYAVHDESRDKYPNAYHIFKNVKFIHEGNVSGLWQAPHAYAAGTSGGSHYSYTNCIFDATESGGYPFDLHNYAPQEGVTVEADGVQLLSNKNQQYVMRFGFNGYSPVTNDQVKYAACFNDVFLKNVLGVGSVLVEPEDSSYSCTNNYRIHNFTSLNLDIKNNQIIA